MSVPSTTLYRHARRPEYLLLSWCIDKKHGWTTAWGKLVSLSEQDVRKHGLEIVLQDLEGFDIRDSEIGSEINGKTPEAKRARKKLGECWEVSISLHPGPKLELQPMQDIGKGRGVGRAEDRSTVPLPCSPEKFFHALNDAFEKCCVVQGY